MQTFKLGRKPVVYNPRRLHLARYLNRSIVKLPQTVPLDISYAKVRDGMLCNGPDPLNPPQIPDGVGCCFWSASVRAAFARAVSTGKFQANDLTQQWAVDSVIEGYSGGAGFDINDPVNTDQGTAPDPGFAYLKNTGIRLPDGSYDKIGAAVAVNPHDPEEIAIAHNLFGGMYVGVLFPGAWETADVWDETNSAIEGGHEIFSLSDVAITPGGMMIDSWGTTRIITWAAFAKFCDQLTITVDPAFFGPNGKAINGFDAQQLEADEAAL